jgi:hypothetical protein
MIRNPGGKLQDCAAELGRGANTISMIVNTDLFRDYLEDRKKEWERTHDFTIRSKVTAVAEAGLDIMLEHLTTKRTAVPFQLVTGGVMDALDRLGYAPSAHPAPAVNVQVNNNNTPLAAPVAVLEEARAAIRMVEQRRLESPSAEHQPPAVGKEEANATLPLAAE